MKKKKGKRRIDCKPNGANWSREVEENGVFVIFLLPCLSSDSVAYKTHASVWWPTLKSLSLYHVLKRELEDSRGKKEEKTWSGFVDS